MGIVNKFFGGPFHGLLVSDFLQRRTAESYDVCDFEDNRITHYVAPYDELKPIRDNAPAMARYYLFKFRRDGRGWSVWVFDPAQCVTTKGSEHYEMSGKLYVFIESFFRERGK